MRATDGAATASPPPTGQTAQLDTRGPYDLAEVATMGFGHRDERQFDGVMRMAFCLDGDYERQVGVELRQDGERLDLTAYAARGTPPLSPDELTATADQVARVVSVNHDGRAFAELCHDDPVLARLHATAPGFRPALFYSPYEAAVWSVISARRARSQGIGLRERLNQQFGAAFELAGVETTALPTPSQLLAIESVPGLPTDRIPRLHAIAEAAQRGELSAARLAAMDPDVAKADVQRLPGIGPFYSALIVIRACGLADVLSMEEDHSRDAVHQLYGLDHPLTPAEYAALADLWRPFRTWVAVMARAIGPRMEDAAH